MPQHNQATPQGIIVFMNEASVDDHCWALYLRYHIPWQAYDAMAVVLSIACRLKFFSCRAAREARSSGGRLNGDRWKFVNLSSLCHFQLIDDGSVELHHWIFCHLSILSRKEAIALHKHYTLIGLARHRTRIVFCRRHGKLHVKRSTT